jgi:hypothetical protein
MEVQLMSIQESDVRAAFKDRIIPLHVLDSATNSVVVKDHIIAGENVAVQGDRILISIDNFLSLFASAASMRHSDLAAAVKPESGWHEHLDRWKAEGLLR